jgi:hypothetical protein
MDEALMRLIAEIGAPVLVILVIGYVLLMPERAQMVAGWIWSFVSRVISRADRTAVALRVQGEVNHARQRIVKIGPPGIMESKLKIEWRDSSQAQAVLQDGDVVVFMKCSKHLEENVACALMAYLPKAVLPRARRYLDKGTMHAADLTLAKSVLGEVRGTQGSLDAFYQRHLDPACDTDGTLYRRITEIDEIDLHGWLLHVLLPEFRRLGDQLHPALPDLRCLGDSEAFARWLHRLAAREAGDDSLPLSYEGSYLRVAIILVAVRQKLEEQGAGPYRRRAKSLIYSRKYDAVYLMARDRNMSAVKEIVDRLQSDGLVASVTYYEYPLRSDFVKRKLRRDRACVACLVPRRITSIDSVDEEGLEEAEVDSFDPTYLTRA